MSYPSISRITPENYQSILTAISKLFNIYGTDKALPVYSIGLSGEVGEVAEILKRYFREGKEPHKEELTRELGDVVAYVVLLGVSFGIDFEDILLTNIRKLEARENNGTLEGSGSDR